MSVSTRYTLGIDPGVNGAMALLDGRKPVWVVDLPTLAAEGAKSRRIIDGPLLIRMIRKAYTGTNGNTTAVLEEVRSMPRDGHVGAFSFGRSFGIIETALAAARVPFLTVRPQVWKRDMRVSADKDQARQRASQLMPAGAAHWPLKKHDGRAEAALMALWLHQDNSHHNGERE